MPPTPAPSGPVVCPAVKPVGKPDAGNRLVRFDERGWAPSYRAHPRLYLLAEQQVFRAIGNLEYKDGKYVEFPDEKTASLAILVVEKLHDAAKELEAKLDHLFEQARQASLS